MEPTIQHSQDKIDQAQRLLKHHLPFPNQNHQRLQSLFHQSQFPLSQKPQKFYPQHLNHLNQNLPNQLNQKLFRNVLKDKLILEIPHQPQIQNQ